MTAFVSIGRPPAGARPARHGAVALAVAASLAAHAALAWAILNGGDAPAALRATVIVEVALAPAGDTAGKGETTAAPAEPAPAALPDHREPPAAKSAPAPAPPPPRTVAEMLPPLEEAPPLPRLVEPPPVLEALAPAALPAAPAPVAKTPAAYPPRAAKSPIAAKPAPAVKAPAAAAAAPAAVAGPPDTPPRYGAGSAANPLPDYPRAARRAGWEGRVILRVTVGADGAGAEVAVAVSSGHAVLDEAALAAVRRWRFQPATRAGRPVAARLDVPIRFRLDD